MALGVLYPNGMVEAVLNYIWDVNTLSPVVWDGTVDVEVTTEGGPLIDGVDPAIKATVKDYANSNPLAVVIVDTTGTPTGGSSVVVTSGNIFSTVSGSVAVTGGTINTISNPVTVTGSVNSTVSGSVSITGGVNSTVSGAVTVSSGNINSTVSGSVGITGTVNVSQTISTPILANALSTTVVAVTTSPARLTGYYIYNPNSSVAYVQIHDTSSVTLGTTTPKWSIGIPATSAANLSGLKLNFATAIRVAATTSATGSTAPSSALDANFGYEA